MSNSNNKYDFVYDTLLRLVLFILAKLPVKTTRSVMDLSKAVYNNLKPKYTQNGEALNLLAVAAINNARQNARANTAARRKAFNNSLDSKIDSIILSAKRSLPHSTYMLVGVILAVVLQSLQGVLHSRCTPTALGSTINMIPLPMIHFMGNAATCARARSEITPIITIVQGILSGGIVMPLFNKVTQALFSMPQYGVFFRRTLGVPLSNTNIPPPPTRPPARRNRS